MKKMMDDEEALVWLGDPQAPSPVSKEHVPYQDPVLRHGVVRVVEQVRRV